jgi:hypothetical protein
VFIDNDGFAFLETAITTPLNTHIIMQANPDYYFMNTTL